MRPTINITVDSDYITPYTFAAHEFAEDHQVTICLDNSAQTYKVPAFLLMDASDYFQAALLEAFEEGTSKTLRLPQTDEDVLQLFLYWLRYRELVWEEHVSDPTGNNFESGVSLLLRAYAFADEYLIGDLFYSIFKTLLSAVEHSQDKVTPDMVSEAFSYGGYNTLPSVLLTRCIVETSLKDPAAAAETLEGCATIKEFLPAYAIQISEAWRKVYDLQWWQAQRWGDMDTYERSLRVQAELVAGKAMDRAKAQANVS